MMFALGCKPSGAPLVTVTWYVLSDMAFGIELQQKAAGRQFGFWRGTGPCACKSLEPQQSKQEVNHEVTLMTGPF